VFNYNPSVHNVVAVDAGGYHGCQPSGESYSSGNDRITLRPGVNSFLCGLNGHCSMGMKMAVTAS
jgi:plastocyanin